MDRSEIDALVQRLVENPHDEEALTYAHQSGEADPKAYAFLLEKVGTETPDPAYASHWLSEAANVWSTTLGDVHRAARVLMMAIDKDPTQQVAAERLAQLYREKGDMKALVALLDRRAKALAPLAQSNPEIRNELAGMHEEMGRLWSEPPLSQPKKAIENYRRAIDLDPQSAYAIFNARELLKSSGQFQDAIPLYAAELAIEADPARRIGLLRDEAATRKLAFDLRGVTETLAAARQIDAADPALQQEYASSVLERIQANEDVGVEERSHASALLVALAEAYEGQHGLAYAAAALDIDAGSDRGMQLYAFYAGSLQQDAEVPARYARYLEVNPNGAMAGEARLSLASSHETASQSGDAPNVLELVSSASSHTGSLSQLSSQYESRPPPDTANRETAPGPVTSPPPDGDMGEGPDTSDGYRRPSAQLSPDKLQGVLDAAQMLAGKGKKPDALAKYKEALESDPAQPEALAWVEDYLRSKRDYAQLRDVLLGSVRAASSTHEGMESRKERLREVAGLCEGNLRDTDGAIGAWKQLLAIDRSDESARTALTRLLEKSQRWDDLANLLEQEATVESDTDTKIALEKKLAKLQEDKRRDLVGAGDAWARISRLVPDDEQAIQTAAKLYERGERPDLAAHLLADSAPLIEDAVARGTLLQRLAELREQLGDISAAGDSYAEAAEALRNGKLWEEAERVYMSAEAWEKAANAAGQRGLLTSDSKQQAQFYARAAECLMKAGDQSGALARLEEATNLDPLNDDYASALVDRYNAADQMDKLVQFHTSRGDRLMDKAKRIHVRREAALLCTTRLGDKELARELWLKVLEDGDDREALERLIDDAVEREDHTEAATLLRRLGANTVDKSEKARVALREAELLAEGVGDIDTAISRYEQILLELDPTCRPALQAIADLHERRDMKADAADALERELKLVADVQERGQIAARLARMYEALDDARSAIRALDLVRKADLEDFDALTRLCELCEQTEQWTRVAELLVERIEVEADEQEISDLTKKLAGVLADKLDRGDEALGALTELADAGDASIRTAYIELGDRLGWKGIVASRLKDWWLEAKHGPERTAALRGALDRFADVGRDQDAVSVAIEIVRTKGADRTLAERLEDLSVKTGDQDALSIAHDLLAREVTGPDRAHELVRQAEVRVRAGTARNDAIQHGEAGLTSISPGEAEPLLERLAQLAAKPAEVIDLYERQVSRSKAPADRMRALARVAQVAASRGQPDRARAFFELALAGAPTDETLASLETCARDGDRTAGGDRLRRALCFALAAGGHGARDGGRTRGALLRRAASMAHKDLNDIDQAFSWLADALVAHVDADTLDALETLALEVGDPKRCEAALTHSLSEVFDGPLVRQLLARRARIRRDQLVDHVGAAADLKKLHDLSPNDQAVMDELSALLTELGDFRSLVQLYEDQILRGKDMNARAELARKVARMWEEQLQDPREAADAWRRVLRMKAGDPEATEGLDRAKSSMLKKPDPVTAKQAMPHQAGLGTPRASGRPAPPSAHLAPTSVTIEHAAPPTASPAQLAGIPAASPETDRPPVTAQGPSDAARELEMEIDRSLDLLELPSDVPSTPIGARANEPVAVDHDSGDVTVSVAVASFGMNEAARRGHDSERTSAVSTERPLPSLSTTAESPAIDVALHDDGATIMAVPSLPEAVDTLESPNDASVNVEFLESTFARPQTDDEEEIIIADDLVDIVEIEEDNPETRTDRPGSLDDEDHPEDDEETGQTHRPFTRQ